MSYPTPGGLSTISRIFTTIYVQQNVGDDPADCGVKGHAVIVHKGGNPTSDDPSEAPGVRVGCCVLA